MALFGKKKEKTNDSFVSNEIKRFEFTKNGKFIVEIQDNFISINSRGFVNAMNKGLTGVKKIDMNNITAVQYKQPGITAGYIQFAIVGSQEAKGGVLNAVKDENTITFSGKKDTDKALKLKAIVEDFIMNKTKVGASQAVQQVSVADELLKYKQLYDAGVLTDEEFETKKKELLAL
ncbi:MAG: SHOCT domain-containing protein [Paraclostridium sordellii]